MVLNLACKGPSKLLFPPKNCPCPTCFQREKCDNLVVVSFSIVSDTSSLCKESKLELIADHVAKLKTTNNDKYIPKCLRNKHALGEA